MFCDMDATRDALLSRGDLISSCAGVEGVWRRIGNFDIAAGDNCPSPWVEILHNGVNYCTGSLSSIGCFSVSYSTNSVSYQRVCGRATVYQKDTPDNFYNRNLGIDSYYVDGISITRGNPRQHIWTYAFGGCRSPPSFVGTVTGIFVLLKHCPRIKIFRKFLSYGIKVFVLGQKFSEKFCPRTIIF